jgi:hypothetical protein
MAGQTGFLTFKSKKVGPLLSSFCDATTVVFGPRYSATSTTLISHDCPENQWNLRSRKHRSFTEKVAGRVLCQSPSNASVPEYDPTAPHARMPGLPQANTPRQRRPGAHKTAGAAGPLYGRTLVPLLRTVVDHRRDGDRPGVSENGARPAAADERTAEGVPARGGDGGEGRVRAAASGRSYRLNAKRFTAENAENAEKTAESG